MRNAPSKLLLLSALVGALGYGMAAARYRLFPYPALERAGAAVAAWLEGGSDVPDKGIWRPVQRTDGSAERAPDVDVVKELANVPYLTGFKPAQKVDSVTIYDPDAAQDGLNLVVSGHGPEAFLQDMLGNTLHTWRRSLADVWSDLGALAEEPGAVDWWRRAFVYPDGSLLAIFDGVGIIKLNAASELLWSHAGGEHHDLDIDEAGNIWVLARRQGTFEDERFRSDGTIKEDFITVLSPGGAVLSELSVLRCFVDSDYYSVLANTKKSGDLLHTNTLELMDGRFADRHPMFEKGNVLISSPMTHTIAVVNPAQKRVVWALSGMWMFQHDPTVLDNGNLLLFDNLGQYGHSKVIEIDPLTKAIVWSYRHSDEHPLSSAFLGTCVRLRNGNTLITESTAGRAIEVTPAGDVVWEFINPERAGEDGDLIASLLDVVRIDHGYFSPDFAPAHGDYVTGRRSIDLAELEELIGKLK